MAYATMALVRDYLPARWRDDAELRARVEDVQPAAEDDVETALSARYTVPLVVGTSPNAYAVVQRLCARLVAARAIMAHRAQDVDEQAAWYARDLERQVLRQLDAYQKGNALLPSDAVVNPDPPGVNADDGYDDLTTTQQESIEPFFSRSKVW